MDDFTKKDKYASLNSAIKNIVSENNDLYQKSLAEKYGFKQEKSDEVEQLDENIGSKLKDKFNRLMNRKDIQKISDIRAGIAYSKFGMKYWHPTKKTPNVFHWTEEMPDTPENRKSAQGEYEGNKDDYESGLREIQAIKDKLKKKGIELE